MNMTDKSEVLSRLTAPLQALKPEDITSLRYYVHSLLPVPCGHKEAARIDRDGRCTMTVTYEDGQAKITAKNAAEAEPRQIQVLFHALLSYARLANDIEGADDDRDSSLVFCTGEGSFRVPGDLYCCGNTLDGHLNTFLDETGLSPDKWCDLGRLTNALRKPIVTHLDDGEEMLWEETPDSSCFVRVGYCRSKETLGVVFRDTGAEYHYFDVPEGEWRSFQSADSRGRYWRGNIRDFYAYERVPENRRARDIPVKAVGMPVVREGSDARIKATGQIGVVADIGKGSKGFIYTLEVYNDNGVIEIIDCYGDEIEPAGEDGEKY